MEMSTRPDAGCTAAETIQTRSLPERRKTPGLESRCRPAPLVTSMLTGRIVWRGLSLVRLNAPHSHRN
jgi:hypothetical protein